MSLVSSHQPILSINRFHVVIVVLTYDNNKNRMLLKKEWLEVRAMQVVEVIIDRVDLLEKIRSSEAKDNKVVKAVEEMK